MVRARTSYQGPVQNENGTPYSKTKKKTLEGSNIESFFLYSAVSQPVMCLSDLLFNVTFPQHRDVRGRSADPHRSWGFALRLETCVTHWLQGSLSQ